jgi:hypothetical protein
MNTVKKLKIALVSITLILSCKNEENSSTKNIINSEDDIAIIDLKTDDENTEIDYLYVTSTSGLSLSENNFIRIKPNNESWRNFWRYGPY